MTTPHDLIEQAYEARDHSEKFALLTEAVRLADLSGDEEAGYDARDELLDAAQEIGDDQTLLLTFGWMLNYADTHPEEEKEVELLWRYKWAMSVSRFLPNVPLERIAGLQDDFARRTRALGLGGRTADADRWRLALHRGDWDGAEQWRGRVAEQPSTPLDCDACDTDLLVAHLLRRGELDAALKAAEPVFSWKQSCNRVPARTHAELLLPLLQAGRQDEAQTHHERGYSLVRGEVDALREQATHLAYLALSGQAEAARKTHAANQGFAANNRTPLDLLEWYLACATAETALGELLDASTATDHAAEAAALAARFDARNGTAYYAGRVKEALALAGRARFKTAEG